jgi:hypothetical protein
LPSSVCEPTFRKELITFVFGAEQETSVQQVAKQNLPRLIIGPEDGADEFLRNVGIQFTLVASFSVS